MRTGVLPGPRPVPQHRSRPHADHHLIKVPPVHAVYGLHAPALPGSVSGRLPSHDIALRRLSCSKGLPDGVGGNSMANLVPVCVTVKLKPPAIGAPIGSERRSEI